MTPDTLFEKRYRQYRPEVQNFVARYVGNYSTAEDITHEIFIKVHKTTQWESVNEPRAYLFATARNHLINHFRQRANHQRDSTIEYDELRHGNGTPCEEMRIEARSDLRNLTAAIGSLSPRARKAFILSRIYRFSYSEVGRKMGISPRTVENHVAKGLLTCTRIMAEYNADPPQVAESNITDLVLHRKRLK